MNMQVTILTIDVPNEMYRAVDNTGREVVLIRNNEIIGEGYTQTSRGGAVAVEMRDDAAKALVANSAMVKLWEEKFPEKKFKYSLFHFSQYTGEYLGENEDEYTVEALMDVRIVDKFNLRYGMVPSAFKEVAGYHAARKECEPQNSNENEPEPTR
ncbi:MAG: hypothetical protein ABWX90_00860 [Candidatus Saccharimonadales bacterium]